MLMLTGGNTGPQRGNTCLPLATTPTAPKASYIYRKPAVMGSDNTDGYLAKLAEQAERWVAASVAAISSPS